MRHAFSLVLVCLLALFMSPGKTQAHGLEQHTSYSISSSTDTTQSMQAVPAGKNRAAATAGRKNCNGSCCGTCICGMSGIPATAELGLPPQRATQAMIAYRQSLRQGPPYPLLRPPRFSA
jgi:hypothetical protein